MNITEEFNNYFDKITLSLYYVDQNELYNVFNVLKNAINRKSQIFVCGNGGSAAIASHFATDFFKGIRYSTEVAPKVISLCENYPLISAISNDIGFEDIFEYQLTSLMKKDDILVAISSSGNSQNIINAIKYANKIGTSIAITGFDKSNNSALFFANHGLFIDSTNYGVVEDVSQIIMHILSQTLRKEFCVTDEDMSKFQF